LGNKRPLEDSDVWDLDNQDVTRNIYSKYLSVSNFYRDRPMLALMAATRDPLLRQLVFAACMGVLSIASPFWLVMILSWLQDDSTTRNPNIIWVYLLGKFCTDLAKTTINGQLLFNGRRFGLQARCILNSEIYEKSLTLDQDPKQKKSESENASMGRIVTLMSSDSENLRGFFCGIHEIPRLFISLICSIAFLIYVMGVSGLIGLLVLVVLFPLGMSMGKLLTGVQVQSSAATDKRINLINEVLQGIRIVKFFAWEKSFLQRIKDIRDVQLRLLAQQRFLLLLLRNVTSSSGMVVAVVTLCCYTMAFKKPLTAAAAFSSLKLLRQIASLIRGVPDQLMRFIPAKVSWDRIQKFLAQEELPKYREVPEREEAGQSTAVSILENDTSLLLDVDHSVIVNGENDPIVGFRNAWFTYRSTDVKSDPAAAISGNDPQTSGSEQFTLRNVNVTFPVGALSVICGPTGCGKTTLLMSLLGESKRLKGGAFLPDPRHPEAWSSGELTTGTLSDDPRDDIISSNVAYSAQTAWLLNATIRENICFGLPFNKARYLQVINACALVKDLETLEGGDLTLIGEKGINLSGGQKQRISLARAAYSRAGIILLDDPLSAVDAPTARHLFKHCILGIMSNRTRLLVTHAVTLVLPRADLVVVMKSGSIIAQGPTSEITVDKDAVEILGKEAAKTLNAENSKLIYTDQNIATASSEEESSDRRNNVEIDAVLDKRPKMRTEGESRATGSVRRDVYEMYVNASGGSLFLAGYLVTFLLYMACDFSIGGWLATWANSAKDLAGNVTMATPNHFGIYGVAHSNWLEDGAQLAFHTRDATKMTAPISLSTFIIVYCLLTLSVMFADNVNFSILIWAVYKASQMIHEKLLVGVLYAPMRFFETTPVGRILNRFSKDIQKLDGFVGTLNSFLRHSLNILMTMFVVGYFLPPFLLAIPPLAWIYVLVSQAYLNTSRELKRLESISHSPIYALFSETLTGVTTIRAYGQESRFSTDNQTKIDDNHRHWFYLWSTQRWFNWRTDVMSAFLVLVTSTVLVSAGMSAGWAGLILNYTAEFDELLLWFIRSSSEVELTMNAVERLREYALLEPEPPAIIEPRPPPGWPQAGHIEFRQLSVRYAPELPVVLKNFTAEIRGGQKIGVVGRTGAGKSSLALSIFRMMPFEPIQEVSHLLGPQPYGTILIDGLDISKIGLFDLRSRLTIIPQDPVLFSGTIRQALDPLQECSDNEILEALGRVQFQRTLQRHQDRLVVNGSTATTFDLSYPVSANGNNLSQGQRQLLCMARALLRKSRVVVLDEATASVDNETDTLMQLTIREHMGRATIFTVAHRLRTIIDYDCVFVLDNGELVECDQPYNLIMKHSFFRRMCEESGELNELIEIARPKHHY
ncbi:P-loop containing nucleoside triphosphate hydrolase protein, partial [Cladochytrium replicatum]